MPITDCPNCGFHLARSTRKDLRDDVPVYRFACGECGHEWTKPI